MNMEKFISYLQSKNLAKSSINHYTDYTNKFFAYCKKEAEQVQKKDVLKYLQYLQDKKGYENITRRNHLIALNHYFTFLLKAEQVASNPTTLIKIRGTHKRHLYKTYTPEELEQLHDNYYHSFVRNFEARCYASILGGIPANQRQQTLLSLQRNYAILGILVYQGTTTKEIDTIFLQDIDLTKATLKVRGGKKSKERTIPLNASQIGTLISYLKETRPQLLEYHTAESEKLFLPLPEFSKKETSYTTIMGAFKPLTAQVKKLDKNLVNFRQVRASVITYWLKTYGLRKAQYYAGHKYISTTENYLPNEMESLTDDISKYNPF